MNELALIILFAGLLPYVCAGMAKWGARDFDNHDPRSWLGQLQGFRARANAAQQNSFEAFPLFAFAMIVPALFDADLDEIAFWGWVYLVLRVLFIYCYVSDRASLRSLVWISGLVVVIRLFMLAI
jgi:uncharacterized MAPEG superfamily protein